MAKRTKQPVRRAAKAERQEKKGRAARETLSQRAALLASPPVRHPTLLGFSILLFAAWFVFLLVTALIG
jgi:hypothetical protein